MLINVQVIQPAQVDDDEIRILVQSYWKHLRSKYSRGEDEREHKRVKMANYMSNKRRAAQVGEFITGQQLRWSILNLSFSQAAKT
jgi:hypothetical protein